MKKWTDQVKKNEIAGQLLQLTQYNAVNISLKSVERELLLIQSKEEQKGAVSSIFKQKAVYVAVYQCQRNQDQRENRTDQS